jgi:hypothetical protein
MVARATRPATGFYASRPLRGFKHPPGLEGVVPVVILAVVHRLPGASARTKPSVRHDLLPTTSGHVQQRDTLGLIQTRQRIWRRFPPSFLKERPLRGSRDPSSLSISTFARFDHQGAKHRTSQRRTCRDGGCGTGRRSCRTVGLNAHSWDELQARRVS